MILGDILRAKRKELGVLKRKRSFAVMQEQAMRLPKKKPRFLSALKKKNGFAVIAEIKKRSPSKGLLCKDFNAVRLAKDFEKNGATALSVLTDKRFFGGSPEILKKVRKATRLPILRKDFILDAYQVFETKVMGADALLLIAAILGRRELTSFSRTATKLGLDVLFEAHTAADIRKILPLKPRLVGINNRDLKNFRVNTGTTRRLAGLLPARTLIVSESGLDARTDFKALKRSRVKAVLVGESFMRGKSPGKALKSFLGASRGSR